MHLGSLLRTSVVANACGAVPHHGSQAGIRAPESRPPGTPEGRVGGSLVGLAPDYIVPANAALRGAQKPRLAGGLVLAGIKEIEEEVPGCLAVSIRAFSSFSASASCCTLSSRSRNSSSSPRARAMPRVRRPPACAVQRQRCPRRPSALLLLDRPDYTRSAFLGGCTKRRRAKLARASAAPLTPAIPRLIRFVVTQVRQALQQMAAVGAFSPYFPAAWAIRPVQICFIARL